MADPCTKSEVSKVSRCGDITWGVKFYTAISRKSPILTTSPAFGAFVGVTEIFGIRKIDSLAYREVLFVCLRFAILAEHQLVINTDGHRRTQTQAHG